MCVRSGEMRTPSARELGFINHYSKEEATYKVAHAAHTHSLTHTYIHPHPPTHIDTHTQTYTQTHTRAHTHAHTLTDILTHTHTHTHTYTHSYTLTHTHTLERRRMNEAVSSWAVNQLAWRRLLSWLSVTPAGVPSLSWLGLDHVHRRTAPASGPDGSSGSHSVHCCCIVRFLYAYGVNCSLALVHHASMVCCVVSVCACVWCPWLFGSSSLCVPGAPCGVRLCMCHLWLLRSCPLRMWHVVCLASVCVLFCWCINVCVSSVQGS